MHPALKDRCWHKRGDTQNFCHHIISPPNYSTNELIHHQMTVIMLEYAELWLSKLVHVSIFPDIQCIYAASYSLCPCFQHSVCLYYKTFSVSILSDMQCVYITRHSVCLYCKTFSLSLLPDIQCVYITRHAVCLYNQTFSVSILQDM